MISFPCCKINLGLEVLNKRSDGYHNVSSVLYPVQWKDILEIVKSDKFIFSSTGLSIPGQEENNLCVKAYQLLSNDFDLSPVHIHLHKVIPMGGGLGGGSADGAETLLVLNKLFKLNLDTEKLKKYASLLGSDCTFFIENKAQYAWNTGTDLELVDLDLSKYYIKLVNLGLHISTAEAYGNISFSEAENDVKEIVLSDIAKWNSKLINSFEESAFKKYPALKEVKEKLYAEGAVFSAMTGSGSTMFGIYEVEPEHSFINARFEKILRL